MSLVTLRPSTDAPAAPLLDVVGAHTLVPLVTGGATRSVYLDHAASAPALTSVADVVAELLPWYGSVHRGAGYTSTVCNEALDLARRRVGRFAGAREGDAVVFTRNTTDSLNLLAAALPAGTAVFTLDLEHHANLLPWRALDVTHLATPATAAWCASRSRAIAPRSTRLLPWRGRRSPMTNPPTQRSLGPCSVALISPSIFSTAAIR